MKERFFLVFMIFFICFPNSVNADISPIGGTQSDTCEEPHVLANPLDYRLSSAQVGKAEDLDLGDTYVFPYVSFCGDVSEKCCRINAYHMQNIRVGNGLNGNLITFDLRNDMDVIMERFLEHDNEVRGGEGGYLVVPGLNERTIFASGHPEHRWVRSWLIIRKGHIILRISTISGYADEESEIKELVNYAKKYLEKIDDFNNNTPSLEITAIPSSYEIEDGEKFFVEYRASVPALFSVYSNDIEISSFTIDQSDKKYYIVTNPRGLETMLIKGKDVAGNTANVTFDVTTKTKSTLTSDVDSLNISESEMVAANKLVIHVVKPGENKTAKKISISKSRSLSKWRLLETDEAAAYYDKELVIEDSRLFMRTLTGKKPINVLPEDVISISNISYIEDVELTEESQRAVYHIKGTNNVKLLFVLPIPMEVETTFDAGTGELISVKRPWWSFLVW